MSSAQDEKSPTTDLARRMSVPSPEGLIARLVLLFAIIFNLYHLFPEIAVKVPNLNDGVLHLLATGRAVIALSLGQDPTDGWLSPIALGYPLFHHYQHLPYLFPASLHFLSLGNLPLADIYNWTRYLLLSFFPLSVYWSMRRFGFARLPSAMGGLLAPLIATDGLYGLDDASYVWSGYGLYTQLWGMFLLPPALAQGYVALRDGRGYVWATLLLAATLLSHLVVGYITLMSLSLLFVAGALRRGTRAPPGGGPRNSPAHPPSTSGPPSRPGEISAAPLLTIALQRGRRLLLLLALTMLVTAYFWVPAVLDRGYMNRSVWEEPGKYDSYGHSWVLGALAGGAIFDYGRVPSLTILAAVGLAVCLKRWRHERYRLPAALFTFWLVIYFGRPTWGALLDVLPFSRDLHLHRLIAGVHLAGIYLMGIGLGLPWQWALARPDIRRLLAASALTTLLLAPAYRERNVYLLQNAAWMSNSRAAFASEAQDLESLTDALQELPPGRVYAGFPSNWGKDYTLGAVPMYAVLNSTGIDMLGALYHALSLNADVQVLFDESRPELYDAFNVRYVVAPADRAFPDFVRPVKQFGRHRLYQVATTGYFDLVRSDLVFEGDRDSFYAAASGWLLSDLPRLKQHPSLIFGQASVEDRQPIPLSQAGDIIARTAFAQETAPGRIVSESIESNAYQAQVEVERDSMLLLKVTYHPNWHASVDGFDAGATMLMPSFIGLKVTPGVHQVRLEYRPQWLRSALLIVGLVALPLIALWERGRRSMHTRKPDE